MIKFLKIIAKVLRLVTLVMILIGTFIIVVWTMESGEFESVVRVFIALMYSFYAIGIFVDVYEDKNKDWYRND